MLLIQLAFVLGLQQLVAQARLNQEEVDEFMEDFLECRQIPGLTVAVVRGGETLLTKGYGVADLENEDPVNQESIFAIASLTKAFTTTLLAKILSEADNVDWNTPVRDVIGEDLYFSSGFTTNGTTFRDLLAHKTGLPSYNYVWILDQFSREEIISRLRFYEPVYDFRTEFTYSNLMYTVAGHAAEVMTSKTWEQLVQEHLLEPIGMASSSFYHWEHPEYEGFVTPYSTNVTEGPGSIYRVPYETWRGVESVAPAGAIVSNAVDMAKWLKFVLAGGVTENGTRLVEKEDMARLWVPEIAKTAVVMNQPDIPVTDARPSNSLGYENGYYRGYRQHLHIGSLSGFASQIAYLPAMDVGIYFSFNRYSLVEFQEELFIAWTLLDFALGEESWFNASVACDMIDAYPPESPYHSEFIASAEESFLTPSSVHGFGDSRENRPLDDYTGVYGEFAHGNLSVFINEDTGRLYMEYGRIGKFDLFSTEQEDVFRAVGEDAAIILLAFRVFFGSLENEEVIETVTLPIFEPMNPPVFIRDRQLADAPPFNIHAC